MPRSAFTHRFLAICAATAALLVPIACKARQETAASSPPGGARPAEAPAPEAATEPILWSRPPQPYENFRTEPVRQLHAAAEQLLGKPLLFRLVPYVDRDADSGEWSLKGETLEVYYQETDLSLERLQQRADALITEVRQRFPDLDADDSLIVHARLPEGKTLADLAPDLADDCGEHNAVRTGVDPSEYEPGSLADLYFALCDGIPALSADLTDPREEFVEENWLATDGSS